MSRQFSGGSDQIQVSVGGSSGRTRAGTIICLMQTTNINAGVISGLNGGTHQWSYGIDTNKPFGDADFGSGGGTITQANWWRVVYTKPSGSATYRYHTALHSSPTWTHQASGSASDGTAITGTFQFGQWVGTDNNLILAALAMYSSVWNDATVEALNWSSMSAWLAAGPTGAWQFNQASIASPVNDLTAGGANQTSITGTTVASDPPGFTYFSGTFRGSFFPFL